MKIRLNIDMGTGLLSKIYEAKLVDIDHVPSFPTVKSKTRLQKAAFDVETNKVWCSGVSIQRCHLLLEDSIPENSNFRHMGKSWGCGGVIASDFVGWCIRDGLSSNHVEDWKEAKIRLSLGLIVCAIMRGVHWVTVIGVSGGYVYALDYGGIYKIPEDFFKVNVYGNIGAPGCLISVGKGLKAPVPYDDFMDYNVNCKVTILNKRSGPIVLREAIKWYGWVSRRRTGPFDDGSDVQNLTILPGETGEIFMRKRGDNATGTTYTFVFEYSDGKRASVYISIGYNACNQLGCDAGTVSGQNIKKWDYAPKIISLYSPWGRMVCMSLDNKSHATGHVTFL